MNTERLAAREKHTILLTTLLATERGDHDGDHDGASGEKAESFDLQSGLVGHAHTEAATAPCTSTAG